MPACPLPDPLTNSLHTMPTIPYGGPQYIQQSYYGAPTNLRTSPASLVRSGRVARVDSPLLSHVQQLVPDMYKSRRTRSASCTVPAQPGRSAPSRPSCKSRTSRRPRPLVVWTACRALLSTCLRRLTHTAYLIALTRGPSTIDSFDYICCAHSLSSCPHSHLSHLFLFLVPTLSVRVHSRTQETRGFAYNRSQTFLPPLPLRSCVSASPTEAPFLFPRHSRLFFRS